MMYCAQCGNKLEEQHLFCGRCGKKVKHQQIEQVAEDHLDTIGEEVTPEEIDESIQVEAMQDTLVEEEKIEMPEGDMQQGTIRKKKSKGTVLKVVLIVFMVVILGVTTIAIYSQCGSYEIEQTKLDVMAYIEENKDEIIQIRNRSIRIQVPEELINAGLEEVRAELEALLGGGIAIEDIGIYLDDQMLCTNLKWRMFKLPLGIKYSVDVDEQVVGIDKIKLGKWNFPLPKVLVKSILGVESLEMTLDEVIPDFIEIVEVSGKRDELYIEAEFVYDEVKETIEKERSKFDPEMVSVYRELGTGKYQNIGNLLTEGYVIEDADLDQVLDEAYPGEYFDLFLVALTEAERARLVAQYQTYLEDVLPVEEIDGLAAKTLTRVFRTMDERIFDSIREYFYYSNVYDYNGHIYNNYSGQLVTIEDISDAGYWAEQLEVFSHVMWDYEHGLALIFSNGQLHYSVMEDRTIKQLTDEEMKAINSVLESD